MRKSRAITVTLLSSLMLTACCVSMSGCSGGHAAPDHTWYDAPGNRIEERWKTDEHGNRVLDAEGRPIPDPHVPYDSYHRPWVYTNGVWAPLPPPGGYSTTHRSHPGLWLWGGSGYRSTSSGPSYRSVTGGGSYSPSRSSSSGSSSISRGGFGSTGSSSSSS